ncbi:proline dehydrogenase family protein [Propionibacteriaceae bacterium Y1923]
MRRTALERLADSRHVESWLRRSPALDEVLDRFLAGEHPAEAVVVALDHASKGMDVSFAQAATTAADEAAAERVAERHLEVVRLAAASGLTGFDVSVGLGPLGLALGEQGPALAMAHTRRIVERAAAAGATVTIDAGPLQQTDAVLAAVVDLRRDHPDVAVTLQAKLRRSAADLAEFAHEGSRVRLCKGAFPAEEPDAYPSRVQVDRSFVRLLRTLMESPAYPMTATHDSRIVSINHELVLRNGRTRDDYEFQMLLGVRSFEHRRLVDTGRRMRVYLPSGPDWFPYVVHRLSDSPRTVALLGRQFVSRR